MANANSNNPNTTFTEFNQPPDLGKEFNHPGKAANNPKGKANAEENPIIPMVGFNTFPPTAACTSRVPIIGPVHENETSDKVKAIKKMPNNPPFSLAVSALLTQLLGKVISNAPKKEAAKNTKSPKKIRLNHTFVDNAFNESAPNIPVTNEPKIT